MGAKQSAPKLKDAARDKETEVVFSATNALFQLGDPAAFQVYYAVLTGERKSGESLADSQMKMLKDPKALTNMGLEAGIGFIPFGGISYKVFIMATAGSEMARSRRRRLLQLRRRHRPFVHRQAPPVGVAASIPPEPANPKPHLRSYEELKKRSNQ